MLSSHFTRAIPLLQDFLLDSAAERPDEVALVTDEGRFTYAEIQRAAAALAWTFVRSGVEPGDRVIVLADNQVRTCIAFWAALEANAVPSLVSPQTRAKKLSYLMADCRPAALVSSATLARSFTGPARQAPNLRATVVFGAPAPEALAELPGGIAWEDACADTSAEPPPRRRIDVDLASIIYTSGSTGEPKGVMHTHRSMRAAATSVGAYLENTSDDVILDVLPLSFDYGLYQMIMAFAAGARLVLERSFALPAHVLRRVADEGVTGFPGVPTMFAMLDSLELSPRLDLSSVRYVTNTAAALMRKHIRALRRTFPKARIYSMYGLTECKRVSFLPPDDLERKPGSVGIAIPNTEVWVVDEQGARVAPGKVGQVVVRGATVMAGYWEKPEATAARLKPGPVPGERMLFTGDWATVDEDGYLYFAGRSDDVIKSRGEKVAPREVEEALLDIPGIREAAVVGVPDPISGQAPKAFIVLEPGVTLTPREVILECRKRLESHMVPKEVVVRPDLPKTTTGKIKKAALVGADTPEPGREESPHVVPGPDPRLRRRELLRTGGSRPR